jgi:hypothetical protein
MLYAVNNKKEKKKERRWGRMKKKAKERVEGGVHTPREMQSERERREREKKSIRISISWPELWGIYRGAGGVIVGEKKEKKIKIGGKK